MKNPYQRRKISSRWLRPTHYIFIFAVFFFCQITNGQEILPTPLKQESTGTPYKFKKNITIAYGENGEETADYLRTKLEKYLSVKVKKGNKGNLILRTDASLKNLGDEGYTLEVAEKNIQITAVTDAGLFYGVQSLLQLLPPKIQAGKSGKLEGTKIDGVLIEDAPKYAWRSFMLDSGRQYQTPEFIKRYLDYMAMMKMNVFHWHLTEGQGWRIEIKKHPKLTSIGSKVATGKEQQGFYSQETIKEVIAYAKKLHIRVVPEIDVPGHSQAALMAYPELTCFGEAPESVLGRTPNIFCAGREDTYEFIQNILDEVVQLFPDQYIHLGGDEAPKDNWDKCPRCQGMIEKEGLSDSGELQLHFSSRLADYLKTKNKKAIFWGDVVYHEGKPLPDNVVVHWWNWYRHKETALKNAIKGGHEVIANTNYYTYLNFPVTPWSRYQENRTFDMRDTYENNPSDLDNPSDLVIGMGACIWTDWYVQEHMVDQRVFPRVYSLAEQMWNKGKRLPFDQFYQKVKNKYPLLKLMGIDYGPALKEEVPEGYEWE